MARHRLQAANEPVDNRCNSETYFLSGTSSWIDWEISAACGSMGPAGKVLTSHWRWDIQGLLQSPRKKSKAATLLCTSSRYLSFDHHLVITRPGKVVLFCIVLICDSWLCICPFDFNKEGLCLLEFNYALWLTTDV